MEFPEKLKELKQSICEAKKLEEFVLFHKSKYFNLSG